MVKNLRPTVMEIDLSIIRHNIKQFQSFTHADIMAVIKANGYGHGSVEIAREAKKCGISYFGVATVTEGIQLRKNGIDDSILVVGGILPEEVIECNRFSIEVTISSINFLKSVSSICRSLERPLSVHLKLDTGMHRIGILPSEVDSFILEFKNSHNLNLVGISTHFPNSADDVDFSAQQIDLFNECVHSIVSSLGDVSYKHTANSAAVINLPNSHFDMVRIGLGLYGYHDNPILNDVLTLQPAMTLKTKVTSLRRLSGNEKIGYGGTFITKDDCTIATIPIGYADGYKRSLSNKGSVLVQGRRAAIVGRICMDQCMFDVTDIEGVKEGSEVVLIGKQQKEEISLYEISQLAGTIPNDILTSINSRVNRVYIEGAGY